jgi:hypothetical protein
MKERLRLPLVRLGDEGNFQFSWIRHVVIGEGLARHDAGAMGS